MLSWGSLLRTARATAGVLFVTGVALLIPQQTADMLVGLWKSDRGAWPAISFHLALWFLAFSAWHWSRAALSARFRLPDRLAERHDAQSLTTPSGQMADPVVLEWLPRTLFLAAAGLGVIAALRSDAWGHLVVILIWVGLSLLLLIWRLPLQRYLFGSEDLTDALAPLTPAPAFVPRWLRGPWNSLRLLLRHAPLGPRMAAGLLVLALTCFVLGGIETFFPMPTWWPGLATLLAWVFPGPGAALLCLGLSIAPLTWLTFEADRFRLVGRVYGIPFRLRRPPIFTLLVGVVLVVPAVINLHGVRVAPRESMLTTPDDRKTLEQIFAKWVEDCAQNRDPVRPVIVALSGGASRAAVWGARVLLEVDAVAKSGNTAIFAVSSVSGGSVGAAAYVAWLAGQSDGSRCQLSSTDASERATAIKSALGADALGPLLAGALFGDVPRALMGAPVFVVRWVTEKLGLGEMNLRGGDRAEALERAFEQNWSRELGRTKALDGVSRPISFVQPFLSLLYGTAGTIRAGIPVWVANGTDEQNGERVLTVPFKPIVSGSPLGDTWPFLGARDVLGLLGTDLPISTAIDNTARFPFLSPAGELMPIGRPLGTKSTQIIDGGYFENEGIQTAVELADWLATKGGDAVKRRVEPILVQATADAESTITEAELVRCDGEFRDDPMSSAGRARGLQVVVPLLGLYNVRAGHTGVVLREVRVRYCGEGTKQAFFHFYLYKQYQTATDVPLNWVLSRDMADYIWNGAMNEGCNKQELDRLKVIMGVSLSGPEAKCRPIGYAGK